MKTPSFGRSPAANPPQQIVNCAITGDRPLAVNAASARLGEVILIEAGRTVAAEDVHQGALPLDAPHDAAQVMIVEPISEYRMPERFVIRIEQRRSGRHPSVMIAIEKVLKARLPNRANG